MFCKYKKTTECDICNKLEKQVGPEACLPMGNITVANVPATQLNERRREEQVMWRVFTPSPAAAPNTPPHHHNHLFFK